MTRIVGVDLPDNKRLFVALTYLKGIGFSLANKICQETGIDKMKKIKELTDEEISKLISHIEKHYKVEGELRREVQGNIQRLITINCYRGIRHKKGLPVRGQRTRTNARTRKGPKKTVAGKKQAPAPK
ncbi:MAG: 30S ribosomal protein S13 [Planctomycetota bacterium]